MVFQSTYSKFVRKLAIAVVIGLVLVSVVALATTVDLHANPSARTQNPYTGQYGSPNCTWYAWQRLHDTEGIDLQFAANANDWITQAQSSQSAWDERSQSYVQAQINTSPAAGDIIVLPYPSAYAHPYHVAYVEAVYNNGTFLVSEQSFGDYSPGRNTSPYPYTRHSVWSLASVQSAEQNQARFLHFPAQSVSNGDNSQLVSAPTTLGEQPGQAFPMQITFANTGTSTWNQAQGYDLACVSGDCSDFTSPSGSTTFGLGSAQVSPGQNYQFNVQLITQMNSATLQITWMLQHNGIDFGETAPLTGPMTIVVVGTDEGAALVSQSAAPTVQTGQQFSVDFVLQNTGDTYWDPGIGEYGLSCLSQCMGLQRVPVSTDLAPGNQTTFTLSLIAPSSPGTYTTQWQMESLGGEMFGPQLSMQVTVQAPSQPQNGSTWVAQSSYPTVQPQQQFTMSFTFRNSGTTTWSDGGGYALACDTYYHSNSNCMGGSPIGFGGQSVAPGQQFTFSTTLTAPSSPGTYYTYWDMTQNGSIFGTNNVYLVVTVQAQQPQWSSWYSVARPACDDSSAWSDVNHAATRDCSSSNGLVLSQYSNTAWAELDLDTPNGNSSYPQQQFRVEVQTGFLNPSDQNPWAALLVQTPQGGACGGYSLAIKSAGNWVLQQVTSSCAIDVLASGQVSINTSSFTMQITVLNNQLSAAINGQEIAGNISDTLNPSPGAIGLMEESSRATSSAILYSNFEIDLWS